MFVIVLDLLRASTINPVQVLKKYLHYIKSVSTQLNSKYGMNIMTEKEQAIVSYLTRIKALPADTENSISLHNFGFPIAVVGITPLLGESSDQYQEMQRQKSWQSQIRKLCLDIGASVTFAPLVVASKESGDQAMISADPVGFAAKLKICLISRMYQEVSSDMQIEVRETASSLSTSLLI
jgi:hypothetical protein